MDVPVRIFKSEKVRVGTRPSNPDHPQDEEPTVENPPGTVGSQIPPVAKRYTSEAAMIADQGAQKSGYLYFDGTNTWWYKGGISGTIADYEEFGGGSGSTDTDAVHYSVADGKNATEKNQARVNIGSTSSTPQIIATAGAINDLAITSNNLVFSGSTVVLSGIVAGQDGEEVTIVNINAVSLSILSQSALSSINNRFNGSVTVPQWSVVRIKYRGTNARWLIETIGALDSRYIRKDVNDTKNGTLAMSLGNTNSLNLTGTGANTSGGLFQINTGFADSSTTPQFYTFQTTTTIRQRMRNKGDWYHDFNPSATGLIYNILRNTSPSFSYGTSSVHGVDAWRFYDALQLGNRSAEDIQALRRDEHRLYYSITVTTSGAINDQALTSGIFNYRFTLATTISGFANGEIGRTIDIDNVTGATLTIQHENAGSVAANRIKLIGSADIVMPIDGKMTLKYCTGSRWELISKNF